MIKHLREGDVVIIWKLDRLGRSLGDLVNLISTFQEQSVGFQSLHAHIDTTTPTGKLTFHLFAALAEFERYIIRSRTKAGLEAARAGGRKDGRPGGLSKKAQDKARLAEASIRKKNAPLTKYVTILIYPSPHSTAIGVAGQ